MDCYILILINGAYVVRVNDIKTFCRKVERGLGYKVLGYWRMDDEV